MDCLMYQGGVGEESAGVGDLSVCDTTQARADCVWGIRHAIGLPGKFISGCLRLLGCDDRWGENDAKPLFVYILPVYILSIKYRTNLPVLVSSCLTHARFRCRNGTVDCNNGPNSHRTYGGFRNAGFHNSGDHACPPGVTAASQ